MTEDAKFCIGWLQETIMESQDWDWLSAKEDEMKEGRFVISEMQELADAVGEVPEAINTLVATTKADMMDDLIRELEDAGWETSPMLVLHALKQRAIALQNEVKEVKKQ